MLRMDQALLARANKRKRSCLMAQLSSVMDVQALARAAIQGLLRVHTGCHGLPKDTGSQSDVPRQQRVCQLWFWR